MRLSALVCMSHVSVNNAFHLTDFFLTLSDFFCLYYSCFQTKISSSMQTVSDFLNQITLVCLCVCDKNHLCEIFPQRTTIPLICVFYICNDKVITVQGIICIAIL